MQDTVRESRGSRVFTGILLFLMLGLALAFRLYGVEWDGGFLFHPDERQVYVLVDDLAWPALVDWSKLLTPKSPWNPGFFAYGSLPLYLLRVLASLAGFFEPNLGRLHSIHLVGRPLSAAFDAGTVLLTFHMGRRIKGRWEGLLAALLVTLTVLHIQLSHFYAVDTVLTFFVMLTLVMGARLVDRPTFGRGAAAGIACGMALATKISAAPLVVPLTVAWGLVAIRGAGRVRRGAAWRHRAAPWLRGTAGLLVTGLVALASFLLWQPYALIDVVNFVVDVIQEGYMARGVADIPYTRQFIGTLPYLYPLTQLVVWSMGVPLGVAGLLGLPAIMWRGVMALRRGEWRLAAGAWLGVSWVLVYFALVGGFHAKFLRYMLPITPLLCIWAAWGLLALVRTGGWRRAVGILSLCIVVCGSAAYAIAYARIYASPHTWIQATEWICNRFERSTRIVVEHWDDPLPMSQGTGELRCHRDHIVRTLPVYDPDDTAKLETLFSAIEWGDHIILSSNRLYNTIPRLPERYPMTSRYYELLMGERLGYELVYYATSYPALFGYELVNDTFNDPDLPMPKLMAEREAQRQAIVLGRADESYSVYDHPKPLVFQKTQQLSRQELIALFGDAIADLPPPALEQD